MGNVLVLTGINGNSIRTEPINTGVQQWVAPQVCTSVWQRLARTDARGLRRKLRLLALRARPVLRRHSVGQRLCVEEVDRHLRAQVLGARTDGASRLTPVRRERSHGLARLRAMAAWAHRLQLRRE